MPEAPGSGRGLRVGRGRRRVGPLAYSSARARLMTSRWISLVPSKSV